MGISSALGSSALLPAGLGFRNVIINGDFRVAQRGASAAMNTGQFAYVSVDRWAGVHYLGGATMAQVSSTAPQGFQYSLKFGRNSGNTSTNNPSIGQTIESVNCYQFQGKQATLSFYAKAGANFSGSSMIVQCVTGTGTDEGINKAGGVTGNYTGTATPLNTTQAITTSWVRYSFLFPVSATAAEMTVFFSYTPSGTAGADDNIYITGVQLEQNYQPTPFEQRPIGVELQLCQRYFQIFGTASVEQVFGSSYFNSAVYIALMIGKLVGEMRTAPSLSVVTGGSVFNVATLTTYNSISWNVGSTSSQTFYVYSSTAVGSANGQSLFIYGQKFNISAEL